MPTQRTEERTFWYRGRDARGREVAGSLRAPDRAAAIDRLQRDGLLVSAIGEAKARPGLKLSGIALPRFQTKMKPGDLASFCVQLASLTTAGVPLIQALELVGTQFQGEKLGEVIQAVMEAVKSGQSMSEAMKAHAGLLPSSLIHVTSVAEQTGRLEQGYTMLAKQYEQEERFHSKIRGAMIYPMVVMAVALVTVLFVLIFVLPRYAALFQQMGAKLPGPTLALLGLSGFLSQWWPVLATLLAGTFLLVRRGLKRPWFRERLQQAMVSIPVVGRLLLQRELVSLSRTLGTMLSSGVPILAALSQAESAVGLIRLSRAVGEVREAIHHGESLTGALRSRPVFDRTGVEMISIGEHSGRLDEMLLSLADLMEVRANATLERTTVLIEPALTLFLGLVVLSIIIPVLLPMFDIFSQIG